MWPWLVIDAVAEDARGHLPFPFVSCTWTNLTQLSSQYVYSSVFPGMGL